MRTSTDIAEIAKAMVAVQKDLKPAIKDATNPAFKSRYADLSAVWAACREPLTKHGIVAVQDVTSDDGGVSVSTCLVHTSGQWLEFGPLYIPLGKKDAQGVGSATSYAKRYGLSAALGIVAEDDDDGNHAVTGAAKPAAANGHANGHGPALISREQVTTLRGDAKASQWPRDKYYQLLAHFGFKDDTQITAEQYSAILTHIRDGKLPSAATQPDDDAIPF